MSKFLRHCAWILLFAPLLVLAATKTTTTTATAAPTAAIEAGKDYEVINQDHDFALPPVGNVQVIEFFSYGCPACNRLEPTLETWLKTKPSDVNFERVPVVFDPGWDVLAEAYYTAKYLNIAEKITPDIFDAIHNKGQDLTKEATLQQFFAQHGVSKQDFDSAFHFSPGIDAQMMRGQNLMRTFNIIEIPTFVVSDKYKTNARMVGGDDKRLMQVVDYLIKKAQQGK